MRHNIGRDDLSTFDEEGRPDMTMCLVLSRVPEWDLSQFFKCDRRSGEQFKCQQESKHILVYHIEEGRAASKSPH